MHLWPLLSTVFQLSRIKLSDDLQVPPSPPPQVLPSPQVLVECSLGLLFIYCPGAFLHLFCWFHYFLNLLSFSFLVYFSLRKVHASVASLGGMQELQPSRNCPVDRLARYKILCCKSSSLRN